MKRNILVGYAISFLNNSWFWIGIWVLYYLKFTNYAGIGVLESVMIVTMTFMEIPTGAVADIFGKKLTIFMAMALSGLGSFIMGFAPNFNILVLSIVSMTVGGALYSGTMEALIYDSLKQIKKENDYSKAIKNISSLQLVAFSIAGAIGGFLYKINPGFPFILTGIAQLVACLLTFLLIEPTVDSVKFSLKNYLRQTAMGFDQLFRQGKLRVDILRILSIGVFAVICWEVLNDALAIGFGFSPEQLGIFASILYLSTAVLSRLSDKFIKMFGGVKTNILIGTIIAISLIVSPTVGVALGGLTIFIRVVVSKIFSNITSEVINANTKSKYRATTISTFSMLQNLPYVVLAFVIGTMIDKLSPQIFAFWLGIVMMVVVGFQLVKFRPAEQGHVLKDKLHVL
jgi:MFS family permease